MKSKILVTGACGLVGSNLCAELSKRADVELYGIDNLSKGDINYLNDIAIELIEADIRDYESIDPAFSGIDCVIHLAAYGSVVESVDDPLTNFEINALGTLNVLRAAAKHGAKKIIFSSTGGALIGNATPPVNETSLPKPISPYGAGKLACEAYCHAFAHSYGLSSICLRFANVYGPNSFHKTGVVNKFFRRVKAGLPLKVFGDGTSTRDYIHVSDLCRGIIAAMDKNVEGNEVFHLASGREVTLNELAKIVIEATDSKDIDIEYHPQRPGEVDRNFARYDKAASELGFEPTIKLEDGLRELWCTSSELF